MESDLEVARNMFASFKSVIDEIADLDMQRRIWLGNLPDKRSSYVDIYHAIEDDINFDLIESHRDELGVPADYWHLVGQLRRKFANFDSGWADPYADEAIIASPMWRDVVNAAKALNAWSRESEHL